MGALDKLDLTARLSKAESEVALARLQRRLLHLRLVAAGLVDGPDPGPPLCVVFEGWDASGKGGAIKRLVVRIDPRYVRVVAIGPPSEIELRHHFLWRFMAPFPGWGEMTVFDRSWYGRVLVERVEELATKKEWKRAYHEIVDFESALVDSGVTLVKLFLHISDAEQLRRFESRRDDPLRSWKLTAEDWRNRARRPDYEVAVQEMLARTDHERAPWDLIAAESKHYARVRVLETVVQRMEAGLARCNRPVPPSTGADFDAGS